MAEKQHSTLAREVLEWLAHNEQGHFNITCQRCGSPFAHEGQPVAAPAEWFGGLDWERQLAESILSLEEQLEAMRDALYQIVGMKWLAGDEWDEVLKIANRGLRVSDPASEPKKA